MRQRRTVRTTKAATRAPPPTPAPMPAFAATERPVCDVVGDVALLLGCAVGSVVGVTVSAVFVVADAAPTVDADGLTFALISTACVGCGP